MKGRGGNLDLEVERMAWNARAACVEIDSLRVLALGRIPRCGHCPRYEGLLLAVRGGETRSVALAPVPKFCTYQVCAPLARRVESLPYGMEEIPPAS